ncbi:MAG: alanine racemase [Gammaproteobacteria bacterium]|nr:alanine racemase [Gammaproteobacteria bacterium]MDH3450287.1 alanine racemase [Gammaproteobacteria bacterium]
MNSHGLRRHPYAVIDLEALRHNYRHLKKTAGHNRLIAVVKADAYGHGAVEVARVLDDADAFAVAAVGEALALREAGIEQKILVLGGFTTAVELQTCIGLSIDPVIHHQFHLDALRSGGDLNDLDIWLKIDSGMGRLGFNVEVTHGVLDFLHDLDTLGSIRLMTHLANADDMTSPATEAQLARIRALELDGYEWGIANSAGILGWPNAHHAWARAGIALYGADPLSDRRDAQRELRPVMTMKSVVLAVNAHARGDLIGYGNTYCCPQDMSVAVVATGYADGYPRHKIDTAQVEVGGVLCDVVGRVSMDMITVDVSAVPDVGVGDAVTLFGGTPAVTELADCSETIAYEILCNVGAHVRREYIR